MQKYLFIRPGYLQSTVTSQKRLIGHLRPKYVGNSFLIANCQGVGLSAFVDNIGIFYCHLSVTCFDLMLQVFSVEPQYAPTCKVLFRESILCTLPTQYATMKFGVYCVGHVSYT